MYQSFLEEHKLFEETRPRAAALCGKVTELFIRRNEAVRESDAMHFPGKTDIVLFVFVGSVAGDSILS